VIKGNKSLGGSGEVRLSDIAIVDTIGAGAQGTVRKAVHKPSKKIIAMKEIPMVSNPKI
jgi:serine/threonine protein kinase